MLQYMPLDQNIIVHAFCRLISIPPYSIYLYIYVVQRIVTTEDRHDRRETLCLV